MTNIFDFWNDNEVKTMSRNVDAIKSQTAAQMSLKECFVEND